jgi:hypothetical protein
MKTNKRLWSYLAQFFLQWYIFETKFVETIENYILFTIFYPNIVPIMKQCEKNMVELTGNS